MKWNEKRIPVKSLMRTLWIGFEDLYEIFEEYGISLERDWSVSLSLLKQIVQNVRELQEKEQIISLDSVTIQPTRKPIYAPWVWSTFGSIDQMDLSESGGADSLYDHFKISLEALSERYELSESLFRARLQSKWLFQTMFSEDEGANLAGRYLYSYHQSLEDQVSNESSSASISPYRTETSGEFEGSPSRKSMEDDSFWFKGSSITTAWGDEEPKVLLDPQSSRWSLWGKILLWSLLALSIPVLLSLISSLKQSSWSYAISDLGEETIHGVSMWSVTSPSREVDYSLFLQDTDPTNDTQQADTFFLSVDNAYNADDSDGREEPKEHLVADDHWVLDFTMFLDDSWEVRTHVVTDENEPTILETVKEFVSNLVASEKEHGSADELPKTWANIE